MTLFDNKSEGPWPQLESGGILSRLLRKVAAHIGVFGKDPNQSEPEKTSGTVPVSSVAQDEGTYKELWVLGVIRVKCDCVWKDFINYKVLFMCWDFYS